MNPPGGQFIQRGETVCRDRRQAIGGDEHPGAEIEVGWRVVGEDGP